MTGNRALSLLTTAWPLQTFLACILLSAGCAAQTAASTPDNLPSAPPGVEATTPDDPRVVIPAGTSIPLVLTRYINSNDVRAGDSVFAQVSTPVMVGDQVAIPAGTFAQGKVEKLTRNGTRAEMTMHSAALVMGSSVIDLGGPVTIESENWTAYNNPQGHKKAAIILAPLLGSGLGMAIGAAMDKSHTVTMGGGTMPGFGPGGLPGPPVPAPTLTYTQNNHRGLFIGSAVGSAIGLVTSFTLMGRSHAFYLEQGSPLHVTLSNAVSVTRSQIAEGSHSTAPITIIRHVPVPIPDGPSDPGTCYTPGTPGTPDVVIPGTPATDTSPGTPSITIPGIPASPPIPHPCP